LSIILCLCVVLLALVGVIFSKINYFSMFTDVNIALWNVLSKSACGYLDNFVSNKL